MPSKLQIGSQMGARVLYTVDPDTGYVYPLKSTDNGDGTFTLKVDTELTATIDPTGLATQTTLAAVLAKLSADPATQTTLAAILAKLIAAPATEAKQDAAITALQLIDNFISGSRGLVTEDNSSSIKTAVEAVQAYLGTPGIPAAGTVNNQLASVVDAVSDLWASTITPFNVTLTAADTEYSQALPSGCKGVEFWSRGGHVTRFAFETGKVATPTEPYMTLKSNCSYESPTTLNLSSKTLYFGTDTAGDVIEGIAWS